jgi:hypothetical protein
MQYETAAGTCPRAGFVGHLQRADINGQRVSEYVRTNTILLKKGISMARLKQTRGEDRSISGPNVCENWVSPDRRAIHARVWARLFMSSPGLPGSDWASHRLPRWYVPVCRRRFGLARCTVTRVLIPMRMTVCASHKCPDTLVTMLGGQRPRSARYPI